MGQDRGNSRSGGTSRPNQPDQSRQPGRSRQPGQAGQARQPDQSRQSGRPERDRPPGGSRPERGRTERDRTERGRPNRSDRSDRSGRGPVGERRAGTARDVDQTRYDGPELPPEITGAELDRNIAAQLRGLPEKLAARVARHLVAAGTLIDTDPETAYAHALAARARASRVAVVREATGETAYAAGHYAEALAELRAAKRMNGNIDYLPVMADCERALGRPERALELAKSPSVAKLPQDQQIEMTLVEAGARHDLGETTSALRTLENAPLRSASREEWVVRLRYAYADLLAQAGRTDDAIEWFHRTAAIDSHQTTDATTRLEALTPQG